MCYLRIVRSNILILFTGLVNKDEFSERYKDWTGYRDNAPMQGGGREGAARDSREGARGSGEASGATQRQQRPVLWRRWWDPHYFPAPLQVVSGKRTGTGKLYFCVTILLFIFITIKLIGIWAKLILNHVSVKCRNFNTKIIDFVVKKSLLAYRIPPRDQHLSVIVY